MITREELQEKHRQAVSEAPLGLTPQFGFDGPGDVRLYEGPLNVYRNNTLLASGTGLLTQRWLPRPFIAFHFLAAAGADWPIEFTGDHDELELPQLGIRVPVSVSRLHLGHEYSIDGRLRRSASTASGSASAVIFHVLNFPTFHGAPTRNHDATSFAGNRSVLMGEKWRVTLDAISGSREALDHADETGSCVVTHVGKLEREDGEQIAGVDLELILQGIELFLSLAKGVRVAIVLPVGLDAAAQPLWTQWRCCQNPTLGIAPGSAFDTVHSDLLTKAFPAFMRRWCSNLRDATRQALEWYFDANIASDVANGVVLVSIALEVIAFSYLIDEATLATSAEIDHPYPAFKRLQRLLNALKIPTQVPTELDVLDEFRKRRGIGDGVECLTQLRNKVVHASVKNRKVLNAESPLLLNDAWRLGLWYFEVTLLALFGHIGRYRNRLRSGWIGEVELVPWAKEAETK